jgi:hypothetical protein
MVPPFILISRRSWRKGTKTDVTMSLKWVPLLVNPSALSPVSLRRRLE